MLYLAEVDDDLLPVKTSTDLGPNAPRDVSRFRYQLRYVMQGTAGAVSATLHTASYTLALSSGLLNFAP